MNLAETCPGPMDKVWLAVFQMLHQSLFVLECEPSPWRSEDPFQPCETVIADVNSLLVLQLWSIDEVSERSPLVIASTESQVFMETFADEYDRTSILLLGSAAGQAVYESLLISFACLSSPPRFTQNDFRLNLGDT